MPHNLPYALNPSFGLRLTELISMSRSKKKKFGSKTWREAPGFEFDPHKPKGNKKTKKKQAPSEPQSAPYPPNSSSPNQTKPSRKQRKKLKQQEQQLGQQQQQQQKVVPFGVWDKILLVGEGDFSFAASLVKSHGCADILATSFEENREAVLAKYPSADEHLKTIEEAFDFSHSNNVDGNEEEGGVPVTGESERKQEANNEKWRIQFSVDARRLETCKEVKKRRGRWDHIWFNFPHVGGMSTDVNRQVRANQALLSDFFESASKLLRGSVEFGEEVRDYNADGKNEETNESGTILVTLFEGLPYRLWNIRDLARNKGLVVRRSWKFDSGVYPGYRHARTAGTIMKGGMDGEEESETAWKGEDRKARTFEFGLRTDESSKMAVVSDISHGKRKREENSSDEDSDDGV